MISQVIRIGLFQPLDMILNLADEEQKRGKNQKKSNFRTPIRLQLPDVVFCLSGVTPNSGLYRKTSLSESLHLLAMIDSVYPSTNAHYFAFGSFFMPSCGIQEWCLNAISVDKGYFLGINSTECYSFSIISK